MIVNGNGAVIDDNFKVVSGAPSYEGLTSVRILRDGEYIGEMSGYSFKYNGNEYYADEGIRCPFYTPVKVVVKNGESRTYDV